MMDELREIHLGVTRKGRPRPSVFARLRAAYEAVLARKGRKK